MGGKVTPSGCCSRAAARSPSRRPKSNSPRRRGSGRPRWPRPQRGGLGVRDHSRSSSGARPVGWANHVRRRTVDGAPRWWCPASSAPVRGSNVHSWWMPAIATQTRSCHHATSHGLESRRVPSACIHCWPVAGHRRVSPLARSTPRSAWLTVSATTTSYPTCRRPRRAAHRARSARAASASLPSTKPGSPLPIRRTSVSPSASSARRGAPRQRRGRSRRGAGSPWRGSAGCRRLRSEYGPSPR